MRAVALLVLSCWLALGARPTVAAEDPREVEGRAAFARGDYDKALEVFSRLFAEHGDPLYLRNIGRCYQKLRKPERAVDAFQEYLRRGRDIGPAERAEVEGFIRDLEALRTQADHPGPSTRPAPAAVVERPAPAAAVVAAPVAGQPAVDTRPPLTRRWWFWTALGAAALAGTVTVVALSAGRSAQIPACPSGAYCPR